MPEKGDQERTEKPTGKKLSKAREEGQVAKSQEVSSAFILLGALGVFLFVGPWMFWALSDFMHGIFQNLGTLSIKGISARAFLFEVLQHVGLIIMPLLLVLLILGIAANLLQVGFLFTLKRRSSETITSMSSPSFNSNAWTTEAGKRMARLLPHLETCMIATS